MEACVIRLRNRFPASVNGVNRAANSAASRIVTAPHIGQSSQPWHCACSARFHRHQESTRTMSQHAILEVPNVMLQKGGFLPTARLSYKTLGQLNSDRSNAVLVPSWYTGTHNDTEAFMVGTNRALDPTKYFI